jgi:hypothetical protein
MRRSGSLSSLDYVAVFCFAALVLLAETLLFHATKYLLDYPVAMTVIGCAVAGLGLGAFLAGDPRGWDRDWFPWCCAGTTAGLYLAAFVLLRHSHLLLLLPAMASVFVFPGFFIAVAFARGSSRGVYLSDMLGAGAAVALTVLAYRYYGTESIFLGIVTVVPLAGALWLAIGASRLSWARAIGGLGLLLLAGAGAALLHQQVTTNRLNIVRLVNPDSSNIPAQSLLRRPSRLRVEKTYDSLEGRLDTIPGEDRVFVTYDGFFNDNFISAPAQDYLEFAKPHDVRFPTGDRRVVYGLVPEPRVFVIGSAADGILKTLRMLTPPENIDAVEINPGVLRMMQHDYFEASGRAYAGLRPVLGNALSVLRRSDRKYDIITLINAHSTRWIGAIGPPDYLHTRESYDLYFDRLTEQGYLLFEERPDTYRGELGVKRMILTLYDCLKRRGVKDPAEHFFIWEFMSHRHFQSGGTGIATGSDKYYVGMIVSLQPLVGTRREELLEWYNMEWFVYWDERNRPVYYPSTRLLEAAYLKSVWHNERFGPFFELLAANDVSRFDSDLDASLITNDRPFPSCSTRSVSEVLRVVSITSGIGVALSVLLILGMFRGLRERRQISRLLLYNIAIGVAFFFVEIVLIQAYQPIFLSPSSSLACVLGVLLIGSAIGGLFAGRVPPWLATAALVPVLLACLRVPDWTLSLELAPLFATSAAVAMIFFVGLNMGVFFPTGLQLARQSALQHKIPHLFALNAVAGAMAGTLCLYGAIRFGYTWMLAAAFGLYCLAAAIDQLARRATRLA